MKTFKSFFKTAHLWIGLLLFTILGHAQPVVKVPPTCNVVFAGTGVGAVTGFGGAVGNGGIVAMPDPFDITGTNGDFNYVPNGTSVISWRLWGDLSVQTGNTPPTAPTQTAGAVGTVNMESYNKSLRFAEYPSVSQPLLNTKWGRSKARVIVNYSQTPCNNQITFDIFKVYTHISPSAVPPIVGPDCLSPNTIYTFSVDQSSSDNANDAIGFDKYYWTGVPSGSTNVYNSADNSSITFTTPATVTPSTLVCYYGRCNPWDGDVLPLSSHTTYAKKDLFPQPLAPTFTTPPPTCLNTGVTSFNVALTPVSGYSYSWTYGGGAWTVTPGGVVPGQNLAVTTVDNNPGTLILKIKNTLNPNVCEAIFTYVINRNFVAPLVISGPSNCLLANNLPNAFSIGPDASNNQTTWTPPSGWGISNANGSGSSINLNVPIGTAAGAYTLTAKSTLCPANSITFTVYVRPGVPTINFSAANNCVVRNGGPAVTYTCTTVPGATSYFWTFPAGWSPATATTALPTVNVTPGGAAITTVNVNVVAQGIAGSLCDSAPSANYPVNYKEIVPNSISTSCFSMGIAGTTNVTVANAPSPFYGTYTVTCSPNTLYSSYSVNAAGVIILNTLASAPAGTYSLTITHTAACGTATPVVFSSVVVAGNGAVFNNPTLTGGSFDPSPGGCDSYTVINQPVGSTFQWFLNGSATPLVANGTTIFISPSGNQLSLCGSSASPTSVCVNVAFAGCKTRLCAPLLGTHSGRHANTNPTEADTKAAIMDGVTVYPNPNNGNFSIKVNSFKESAVAIIYDMSGKQLGVYDLKKGDNKIQKEGLTQGTYTVTLLIDGVTDVRKIIIK